MERHRNEPRLDQARPVIPETATACLSAWRHTTAAGGTASKTMTAPSGHWPAMLAIAASLAAACGSLSPPAAVAAPSRPTWAAAALPPAARSAPALKSVRDPGRVTGVIHGPRHARDGGQIPDPACTPGAYDPAITAAVLCAPGYTISGYRPPEAQSEYAKWHVVEPAYGQGDVSGELDHLVALDWEGLMTSAICGLRQAVSPIRRTASSMRFMTGCAPPPAAKVSGA